MKELSTNFLRSSIVESSHKVKLLIATFKGDILLNSGNADDLIYPRSSIKIFQAIPFISSNAHSIYELNSKQIVCHLYMFHP